jgi:hypothetical protein
MLESRCQEFHAWLLQALCKSSSKRVVTQVTLLLGQMWPELYQRGQALNASIVGQIELVADYRSTHRLGRRAHSV